MTDFEYEIVGEMRKIRKLKPVEKDNFSINTMETLIDAYNNIMGVVVLIGLAITGISLFVGGIGVMNIMFVSVTERTREIGIRKAIGAKKRSILTQFLFESSTICMIGGIIGVILSFFVAELINQLLLPASVSLPIVFVALFDSEPRICICDSRESEITLALEKVEGIRLSRAGSPAELKELIENNNADLGLVIERGFDQAVRGFIKHHGSWFFPE